MSSIDNSVVVQIDRTTKFPTRVGFGVPMILDINTKQPNDVDVVTSIEEVEALGFVAADEAHKAASAMFSQSPRPEKVLIGKRAANVAQVNTIVVGGNDDGSYEVTINGVAFAFAASSNTAEEIRDGLIAAINGGSEPVTAAPVSTDTITLTADSAGVGFSSTLTGNPNDNLSQTLTTANVGAASEVARLSQINNDWYFLVSTDRTEQTILDLVGYIETIPKMYFFETDQAASKDLSAQTDTTSILGQVAALNVMRTVGAWTKSSNLENYPMAAWIGENAPKDAGSITWKFKSVNGVVADDELTSTDEGNIKGKNANIYTTVGGIPIFEEGTTMDGDFIDLVRGTDKLSRRLQESVFALFTQEDKVPFNNKGIEQLGNAMKEPLQESVDEQFLTEYSLNLPDAANIPAAEKAIRFLDGADFEGTIAGAIHKTRIVGRLTL